MPLERERLIFFAYFHSRSYKTFLLEASERLGSSCLDADLVVKVWEDGFLQHAASENTVRKDQSQTVPPLPTVVDASTGQVQSFSNLDMLSSSDLVLLFAQLEKSDKVLHLAKEKGVCARVSTNEDGWTNPCIELLTKWLKFGSWNGADEIPEVSRMVEAKVDDSKVVLAVCFAHELWGTHLLDARMSVAVDTLLGRGITEDTEKKVTRVMENADARRPSRELMAAFALPAPFGMHEPNETVMHFATPLLRVLPIGPVRAGSGEHRRLEKYSPLILSLRSFKGSFPRHYLCLEGVEWAMEAYRLSVEAMLCRNRDNRRMELLSCNCPHLRVPMDWRRTYNKMGVESIDDLIVQDITTRQ